MKAQGFPSLPFSAKCLLNLYPQNKGRSGSLLQMPGDAWQWHALNGAWKDAGWGRTVCPVNANHRTSLRDPLTSYTLAQNQGQHSLAGIHSHPLLIPLMATERPSQFLPLLLLTQLQVPSFLEDSESSCPSDPYHHFRRFWCNRMMCQHPDITQSRCLL